MGRFGHGKSDGWRKKTHNTAASHRPVIAGMLNPNFPWAEIRRFTDTYLRKKGDLNSEERDTRLKALVQKHGAKDIALAACAHAMSPAALRDLLVEERTNNSQSESDTSLSYFLQTIIIVHHANPEAVGEADAQIARILLTYSISNLETVGQTLGVITEQLIKGVSPNSLLHQDLRDLMRKLSSDFADQLEVWKDDCQWLKVYAAVEWLSILTADPDNPSMGRIEAINILNETFKEWRQWTMWKPDVTRLRLREEIGARQRSSLKDLLAMEGPDFERTQEPTLRDALLIFYSYSPLPILEYGTIRVKVMNSTVQTARETVDRLSKALDAACKAGSDDVDLLIHLCVDKLVDHDVLKILEGIISAENALLSADMLQVYQADNTKRASQTVEVTRICQALGEAEGQNLREDLAPYLVDCILRTFQELKDKFLFELQSGQPMDDRDKKLYKFGKDLQGAQWILPMLDGNLRKLFNSWPTPQKMTDMRNLWNAIHNSSTGVATSLSKKLIAYHTEYLIEPGTIDIPTRTTVDALIHLWHEVSDADRRSLALLVAEGPWKSKDLRVRCTCLAQLHTLPIQFVGGVLKALQDFSTDPDKACVNLGSVFASTTTLEWQIIRCWRPPFLYMIKLRESTLIDFTLQNFTATEWLQWLEDIRMIFIDMEMHNPFDFPTILRPSLHEWCQRISPHIIAISYLESVLGSGTTIRCLLTGFQGPRSDCIIQILEMLTSTCQELNNRGEFPPAMLATVDKLEPDGSNARDVQRALSFLKITTTPGNNAYLRILDIYQQSSPQAAMVLSKSWQEHPNMTTDDKLALEALTRILGVDLLGEEYSHAFALEAATEFINEQVTKLLNEAQRLSAIRLALKGFDPEGTSEFLAEHGIDDISPLDNEIANLPIELVHVIEKVGEDEVELHFPLVHLTKFQRVAMGAGESQSLLVRLILGNYGNSPRFCIHLDTELQRDGHIGWNHPDVSDYSFYSNSGSYDEDTAITVEIRKILRTTDLMTITPKRITLVLEKRLGVRLDAKRDYINSVIKGMLPGAITLDDKYSGAYNSHIPDDYCPGACNLYDYNDYYNYLYPGDYDQHNSTANHQSYFPSQNTTQHSPWFRLNDQSVQNLEEQSLPVCQTQITRITYQLGRVLSKHLLQGSKPIAETYYLFKSAIDDLRKNCLVCGFAIGVRLQQSTVCPKPMCRATWLTASLNLQLADFHQDSQAADLLLTSVQAAAHSGNMALLPGCTETRSTMVTQLLGKLPSVTILQATTTLNATFKSLGKRTEALVSWALGNHGGYLVSATGPLRIPSISGAYQFVLANAAPDLEKFFAAQLNNLPTHVMFHGTSLDRLYAILCQGLRVCSGTHLMRHGAASGNGIYVTDTPATALSYAPVCGSSTDGWSSTTYRNIRVLLGCEASGTVPTGGVRVVANPSQLILRYVFIMTAEAAAPQPQHIVPSMMSVFASLRSGGM